MTANSHRASGQHWLADLSGVAPALLTSCASLEALLCQAAAAAGAHVLHSHFHSFGEQLGVTGVVLLAESHISIHTWPEEGFAAADIFMCGNAQPERALAILRAALPAADCQVQRIRREALPLPA